LKSWRARLVSFCTSLTLRVLVRKNGEYRVLIVVLRREFRKVQSEILCKSLRSCGEGCTFNFPLRIEGASEVSLGARVSIAPYTHIWGHGGVDIGDDCLIAAHVAITSVGHAKSVIPYNSHVDKEPVTIGRNVWIGAHAVILPGVTIGDDAIIGAGAVVTGDVPRGSVFAGVPARPLELKHEPRGK